MGIERQVAQVSEIVGQALAGRQEKIRRAAEGKTKSKTGAPDDSVKTISKHLARINAKLPPRAEGVRKSVVGWVIPRRGRTADGLRQVPSLPPVVRVHQRPAYVPDYSTPRFRLTPKHFAYVKIAEGCNHPCSFCVIPGKCLRHASQPATSGRGAGSPAVGGGGR